MNKISIFVFQILFLSSVTRAEAGFREEVIQCDYLENTNITASDLNAPTFVVSALHCCNVCSNTVGCLASVFGDDYLCHLKETTGPQVSCASVTSILQTTPPPTPAPLPPSNGLLAAWSQTGGTYADGTDQVFRYSIWNGVVRDALTSMEWEQTGSTSPMSWSSVPGYCAAQTTGGFSNWRAPNIGELQTLVDYTIANPIVPINAAAFPNTTAADFWSSSPDVGNAGNSWTVQFGSYGISYWDTVATLDQVRCVRSSYPVPPTERYTIASGVVTDTVTGLVWQQHAPTSTYTQSEGSAYCSALNLGGFDSGWRLPTIKELATLIDYSVPQGSLMMDATAFAGEQANWFWSSTPVAGNPSVAWDAFFYGGNLSSYGVASGYYVRCLR